LKSGCLTAGMFMLALFLSSCSGSSSSNPSGATVSGVKPRAFVSNSFAGRVQIVNAGKDSLVLTNQITVGVNPGLMVLAPNKLTTLVFNNGGGNNVSLISNSTESQTAQIQLPGPTESIVISPDNNTGYAACPNASPLGRPAGILQVMDLIGHRSTTTLNVPKVRRLVINHAGTRILAFSDNSNSVTVIDTTQFGLNNPITVVPGFDQPVWGVFSDDDNTAYILNCGPECGGVSAGMTQLNMANDSPGGSVALSGATYGTLLNGSLYVAGSASGSGTLQVVDPNALTASAPVAISNGYHDRMELGADNKLFIGATGCGAVKGCLTIFDTGAQAAVVDAPFGDVTGIAPIPNRSVVYVIEGGELRIFDTKTSAVSTTAFIDIVGPAVDVKEID